MKLYIYCYYSLGTMIPTALITVTCLLLRSPSPPAPVRLMQVNCQRFSVSRRWRAPRSTHDGPVVDTSTPLHGTWHSVWCLLTMSLSAGTWRHAPTNNDIIIHAVLNSQRNSWRWFKQLIMALISILMLLARINYSNVISSLVITIWYSEQVCCLF